MRPRVHPPGTVARVVRLCQTMTRAEVASRLGLSRSAVCGIYYRNSKTRQEVGDKPETRRTKTSMLEASVRLPPETMEVVKTRARARGRSVSQLIREAVEAYLGP